MGCLCSLTYLCFFQAQKVGNNRGPGHVPDCFNFSPFAGAKIHSSMQILRRRKFEMNRLRACHVMADPIGSIGNVHSTQGVWLCVQSKKEESHYFLLRGRST